MDHETTLANAKSAKTSQTFDNTGSSATALFNNSLASNTDDNAPTTVSWHLH